MRTGDTTSSQRARMVRTPPSFVVTTPESLYLLVTSASGRAALRTVETVIVDEIHAVARDKRGAHLALTLERLEALCDGRPSRVGLSATQRPIETVARLLVGDRPLPVIVDSGHQRDLDLAIELPEGELEAVESAEQMADVLDRIADARAGAPHDARVRQHAPARRAPRPPARRAARRRRRRRAPRQPVEGSPLPRRVAAASRRPQGARRDRVARARHRHRAGRARVPDRLAPQHRDVPAARRPLEPLACRCPEGTAVPARRATSSSSARRCSPRSAPGNSTRSHPPHLPLDILAQQIVAEVAARRVGHRRAVRDGAPRRAVHRR